VSVHDEPVRVVNESTLAAVKEELTVPKEELSSTRRRKISAPDERASSTGAAVGKTQIKISFYKLKLLCVCKKRVNNAGPTAPWSHLFLSVLFSLYLMPLVCTNRCLIRLRVSIKIVTEIKWSRRSTKTAVSWRKSFHEVMKFIFMKFGFDRVRGVPN
jgi:hypothetical protein